MRSDLAFAVTKRAQAAIINIGIPIVITTVTDRNNPVGCRIICLKLTSRVLRFDTGQGTNGIIKDLMPEATRVGVIFNSSEDNSLIKAKMAEDALKDLGLEYVELTVSKLMNSR